MESYNDLRLEALRRRMTGARLDGILVSRPENDYYLSGFSGDTGYLVVSSQRAILFVDSRFSEQGHSQCPSWEVRQFSQFAPDLVSLWGELDLRYVGVESQHLSMAAARELERLAVSHLVVPLVDFLEQQRATKEEQESVILRQAARSATAALEEVLEDGLIGRSEEEIAWRLEMAMHSHGAQGPSFETIVASGTRAALPHGVASPKVVEAGEMVLFDWGVRKDRYCSDCTRVVFTSPPTIDQERIYAAVLNCQEEALRLIVPGARPCDILVAAREILQRSGYGDFSFQHGLGHGLGLEVHELPFLRASNEEPLQAGQVITIEPGVYIPGWGGVRIEDTVLVTEGGSEIFTSFPKTIIIA
ncbi:MAG: Xaa-Pro peptidase family protein [Coprothermobacterota bacterium]|nr:Xaa-Pro peptidase family protein [Coprothermobacterota bacterium]